MYSWMQRLRSLRHRFWFAVSERIGWSRGVVHETPALELHWPSAAQRARAEVLVSTYGVRFERSLSAATSVNNYEYLDILDRAWTASKLPRPTGGVLCDVGCASFWYAEALQAFFEPRELIGIEVEGHRLFRDGHTRIDHAAGFTARLPNARFLIADYAGLTMPADVITAWFPFVTPAAILAWRLPLRLLAPERLFARIFHNLEPGGSFVMVNHGPEEARIAATLCAAAGLECQSRQETPGLYSGHRLKPAVLSVWRQIGADKPSAS